MAKSEKEIIAASLMQSDMAGIFSSLEIPGIFDECHQGEAALAIANNEKIEKFLRNVDVSGVVKGFNSLALNGQGKVASTGNFARGPRIRRADGSAYRSFNTFRVWQLQWSEKLNGVLGPSFTSTIAVTAVDSTIRLLYDRREDHSEIVQNKPSLWEIFQAAKREYLPIVELDEVGEFTDEATEQHKTRLDEALHYSFVFCKGFHGDFYAPDVLVA